MGRISSFSKYFHRSYYKTPQTTFVGSSSPVNETIDYNYEEKMPTGEFNTHLLSSQRHAEFQDIIIFTQLSEREIIKQKDWRANWLDKIEVTLLFVS
jgi:hypothetical protein